MDSKVVLVMVIAYTIALLVLYHKVFIVYYFDVFHGLLKELVGALFGGIILAAITLYLWWLAAIIILIAGISLSAKIKDSAVRGVVMAVFVVTAIIVSVVGIKFKKNVDKDRKEKKEAQETQIARNDYSEDADYIDVNTHIA